MTAPKQFEWCGYKWECCMEGGRLIHPDFPYMWYDSDMVMVTYDDTLILNSEIKPNEIKYWNGKIYYPTYATGVLRSVDSFLYGKFSCDIKLPDGTNCWPSFWITGANSWPPEIDIMEGWSNKKGSYFKLTIPQFPYLVPSWWTTNNAHYLDEDGVKKEAGSKGIPICKSCTNPKNEFVNYSCVWNKDKITFYVNNKQVREIKRTPNMNTPMRVVVNLFGEEKDFKVNQPMLCKNFNYTDINKNG